MLSLSTITTTAIQQMKSELMQPFIAVTMGTGIGLLLSVFGQKALNQHAINTCPSRPTHQLVHMANGFVGDATYCVNKRYL